MHTTPKIVLLIAGLGLLASACGQSKSSSPAPAPTAGPTPSGIAANPATSPSASPVGGTPGLPAQTLRTPLALYLAAGTVLPSPLKAASLVVSFHANDPSATFECLAGWSQQWLPCNGGASYDFGRLIDHRGYTLKIRAKAEGIVSDPPLLVTFVADLQSGQAPTLPSGTASSQAAPVSIPQDATALPAPTKAIVKTATQTSGTSANATITPTSDITAVAPLPAAGSAAAGRVLQVGNYFALNVPASGEVTGYATDKTYNAAIVTMTILAPGLSSFLTTPTCALDYQRIVTTADGTQYCQGTPTAAQLAQLAGAPIPTNFIDVALPSAIGNVGEKLLVAAFDEANDPAGAALSLTGRCAASLPHGATSLPLLPQFYGSAPIHEAVSYCETTDGASWWWVAFVTAQLGSSGAHLEVLYTADAGLGIVTETQFVDRLSQRLEQLLQPIAPYAQ